MSGSKRNLPKLARNCFLQMHGCQPSSSGLQILKYISALCLCGIGDIAEIRIHIQIQRINEIYIFHGFLNGIHKRSLHCLESKDNALCRCHLNCFFQILGKPFSGLFTALFIIYIIPCQLNDTDSEILCQFKCFLHNLHTTTGNFRLAASQRIFSMSAQAHCTDWHSRLIHQTDQFQTLLFSHVKTFQLFFCLINTDLYKIIARSFCCLHLFLPA